MSKKSSGKSNSSPKELVRESPLRSLIPCFAIAWLLIFWARFFLTVLAGVGTEDIDRFDIAFAVPEILSSAIFPEPSDSSNWMNLGQRVPVFGYACFILACAFSTGRLLLRSLKLQFDLATDIAFSCGIGLSGISLMTLVFGTFGVLSQSVFITFMLLPIAAETTLILQQIRKGPSSSAVWIPVLEVLKRDQKGHSTNQKADKNLRRERHTGQPSFHLNRSTKLIAFLGTLFLIPMLCGAMLPSTDFDVKEYHLEGPKEYLLAGQIHFLPHNVYTSFPFLTEMLTLCGMVLKGDWFLGSLVGKTVLMFFAPITAIAVFAVGRKIAGETAGALAALIYLSTPWTYRISIIAYTEGAMCCFVILSLLALLHWKEETASAESALHQRIGLSLLCGILAGSTIATKYPGIVLVAIPVAIVMLLTVLVHRIQWQDALTMAAVFILGGAITFGPWVTKNIAETGNPVYPLMYSVFGGEDWNEELNEKWKSGHARPSPLIKSPIEMMQEFKKYSVDVALGSVWQSALIFGPLPLVFLYRRRSQFFWFTIGAAVSILLVWYTLTHLIDRFWVPVLPVLSVLSAIGLLALQERLAESNSKGNTLSYWAKTGLNCLVCFTLVYNFAFMTTPACGNNTYLMSYDAARKIVKPASVVLAEQAVGAEGKVLFVGEAMVFDAECAYKYNTVFDISLLEEWTSKKVAENKWKLLPAETIRKKFAEEGITHVLINWNEILRYRTTYGYTDFVSPKRFKELESVWPFVEVPIPDEFNLREWDSIDDSWKTQIENWGPELKRITFQGETRMKQYQLFELKQISK